MLTESQIALRLILTVFLSGLIGLERQLLRRTAGLRTHILVSLGSCLIMLTSLYVFDIYRVHGPIDPSRIAAGVITGIGFLGAGTIITERGNVKGLTTAASLWVVAGIGLAVGCGFYSGSVITTMLALVVLFFLRRMENIALLKEADDEKQRGGQ